LHQAIDKVHFTSKADQKDSTEIRVTRITGYGALQKIKTLAAGIHTAAGSMP
jgi:hypothetical protein